jgi:glycosyltransferase involved in cell wall biosynthesis
MSQPFFSIVIPVFGTEAFLEQCLLSIKAQIFSDYECVVVNDGSLGVDFKDYEKFQDRDFKPSINISNIPRTNQVQYIFDKIVGDDSRFKLVNKENGGVSSARNAGLKSVTGKWLLQLDPDDWILPEHLQGFYDKISNYKGGKLPIVRFISSEFYNTKNQLHTYLPKKLTLGNTVHSCTLMNTNYAINLDLVRKYNLKFDEKLGRGSKIETRISNGGEDFFFGFQYLEAAEKEHGKGGFEMIPIDDKTYKYRELLVEKKSTEDDLGPYNYAKYFQQFGYQNPNLNIKIITFILPFWARLRFYKNPLATVLRKVISLFLRLIS